MVSGAPEASTRGRAFGSCLGTDSGSGSTGLSGSLRIKAKSHVHIKIIIINISNIVSIYISCVKDEHCCHTTLVSGRRRGGRNTYN